MAFFEPQSLSRIAEALETLVKLYKLDLESRSIRLDPTDPIGEGEILVTDDAETAEFISRILANRPVPFRDSGFTLPDRPLDPETPPEEVSDPNGVGDSALFGRSWGINQGPEGSEEDWGGPPSDWRTGK